MAVNDELAKIVSAIPHAHYCAVCDEQFRCVSQCWGQTSFLCQGCETAKYGENRQDDAELDS